MRDREAEAEAANRLGTAASVAYAAVRAGDIRSRNRRLVLEWIERHGPISRAQISRLTQLSQPSVSEIVNDLLGTGLVKWGGEGDSTGGRRPRLLRFNPARGTVLAADLGGTTMAIGLFHLDGSCVREERFAVPKGAEGPVMVERLVAASRQLIAEASTAPGSSGELLAIGIGAPGVTDVETGEVSLAPAVGWEGTSVRHFVEQELGIPVAVDNDVNAAALAEWRFGGGGAYRSFAFVSLGTGVGMGILLEGKVHRGSAHQAGEIGYSALDPDWEIGASGFGNLDERLSMAALGRDYAKEVGRAFEGPDAAVERLFADHEAGKAEARNFLAGRMRILARALVNVQAVLAPEAIFLGGPISPYVPQFLPLVEEEMSRLSPLRFRLERSALQQRAGLVGACALASDRGKEALVEEVGRAEQRRLPSGPGRAGQRGLPRPV